MTLDKTVQALERAMQGKPIDKKLLKDKKTARTLNTFFFEQEARPELTSLLDFPSLMYDYLQLPLERREEFDEFRKRHPEYLKGNGKGNPPTSIRTKEFNPIAQQCCWTNQLIKIFDFYLEHLREGEVFNVHYLIANKKLRRKYRRLGHNIYQNAYLNLENEGGIRKIVELAAQQRPEILEHWEYLEMHRFSINQAVQDLIRIFDFYLKHRKRREIFNSAYLEKNQQLRKKFRRRGKKLCQDARRNLGGEGGIKKIVELAAQQRPEILEHWEYLESHPFSINQAVQDLIRIFDFYLQNLKEGQVFNGHYLRENKKLPKKLRLLGKALYQNAYRNRTGKGDFQKIVELASRQRPEILEHWSYRQPTPMMPIDKVIQSYIKHRPQNRQGLVPLTSWFRKYDLSTGERLVDNDYKRLGERTPQAWSFYEKWVTSEERKQGVGFEEWILNQTSTRTQDRYFSIIYRIKEATQGMKALQQAIDGSPKRSRKKHINNYVNAYFFEQEAHPQLVNAIRKPFNLLVYFSLSNEARLKLAESHRKRRPSEQELLIFPKKERQTVRYLYDAITKNGNQ